MKKRSDEDKIALKELSMGSKLEDSIIRKLKKYLHLHLDNYESHHGRRIEGTLFFLNFLAILIFSIETFDISPGFYSFLRVSEMILVSIFVVEYISRMWVADKKIKHFFNIYSLVDLISILPILVNFINFSFLRIFRILRLFRILRILRFQRIFKAKDTMFGKLSDTQLVVTRIVLTVFTIIFVSSGFIWAVENKINPGGFGNILDALYFSIVTLATVGYGDVTPLSGWGKAITVAMILSGIALIPWQLGKLVKILFMSATKTQNKCVKCGFLEHDRDAKFCKNCGKKLPKFKEEETLVT
jgi:voltage-gated potassium channel